MDIGKWRGVFDWSMRYADGTHGSSVSEMPEDNKEWLLDALQHYMQDFADRMKEIKKALDGQGGDVSASSLEEKEQLLEELMDIVSSIDFARDLHKIGGLNTLLDLLSCPHPSLRWRAAEVVATCVQNNPPVQQWFMDGGIMPPLRALLQDDNTTCRTKALLALSAMIRHFAPARIEFLEHQGMQQLVLCARSQDPRLARKALGLLQYFCHKDPSLGVSAKDNQVVPALMQALEHEDSGIRQAALEVLLDLARIPDVWHALQEDPAIPAKLQQLQHSFRQLPADAQEDDREELDLCEALTAALKERPETVPATQHDDIDPTTSSSEAALGQRHTESLNLTVENQTASVSDAVQPGTGTVGQAQVQASTTSDSEQQQSTAAAAVGGNGGASWSLVPVPDYDPR